MYVGYLILLFGTRTPFSKIYDTLEICKDGLTCTAEQFFDLLLADGSNFTNEYRAAGKDFNLKVSPTFRWLKHVSGSCFFRPFWFGFNFQLHSWGFSYIFLYRGPLAMKTVFEKISFVFRVKLYLKIGVVFGHEYKLELVLIFFSKLEWKQLFGVLQIPEFKNFMANLPLYNISSSLFLVCERRGFISTGLSRFSFVELRCISPKMLWGMDLAKGSTVYQLGKK